MQSLNEPALHVVLIQRFSSRRRVPPSTRAQQRHLQSLRRQQNAPVLVGDLRRSVTLVSGLPVFCFRYGHGRQHDPRIVAALRTRRNGEREHLLFFQRGSQLLTPASIVLRGVAVRIGKLPQHPDLERLAYPRILAARFVAAATGGMHAHGTRIALRVTNRDIGDRGVGGRRGRVAERGTGGRDRARLILHTQTQIHDDRIDDLNVVAGGVTA